MGAKALLVLKFMLKMIPFLFCLADAGEHSAAKNYHNRRMSLPCGCA
jgi:hypothetical protein